MALNNSEERIAWLDVESDGINPYNGQRLLQVACIVTDGNLKELNDGFMRKIYYSPADVEAMRNDAVPFVRKMHDDNGLWASLSTEGIDLGKVEEKLLEELEYYVGKPGFARLGGNSITLDRNFLAVYMPNVLSYLHYRNYDMTSVGGFFELFRKDVPQFEKSKSHDALDDIRESLAEARHYAKYLTSFEMK